MINGGYLILDFKNANITTNPQTIDGILFKDIIKANKPVIMSNIQLNNTRSVLPTYAIMWGFTTFLILVCSITTTTGGISGVRINSDNTVQYYNYVDNKSLNLESEVSTNASKSDSNTDK